jgi:hypothetical protein
MMARRGLSEAAIKATANFYQERLIGLLNRQPEAGMWRCFPDMDGTINLVSLITLEVDPSLRGTYTRWIVNRFACEDTLANPFEVQDRITLNIRLHRYDLIKPLIPDAAYRDINHFRTVRDFYDFMATLEEMDVRSIRQRDRDEENELIEQGAAKIIFNDELCKILQITTAPAAILFGHNTKWCVTSESTKHFNTYIRDGLLFYIIQKGEGKNERYALSVPRRRHRMAPNILRFLLSKIDIPKLCGS